MKSEKGSALIAVMLMLAAMGAVVLSIRTKVNGYVKEQKIVEGNGEKETLELYLSQAIDAYATAKIQDCIEGQPFEARNRLGEVVLETPYRAIGPYLVQGYCLGDVKGVVRYVRVGVLPPHTPWASLGWKEFDRMFPIYFRVKGTELETME